MPDYDKLIKECFRYHAMGLMDIEELKVRLARLLARKHKYS